MNSSEKLIAELYEAGDRDILFFEYIYGNVKFDELDNTRSEDPFQIIKITVRIIHFLVGSGDFYFFVAENEDGKIIYLPMKFDEIETEKMALNLYQKSGSEQDFGYRMIIRKAFFGKIPPIEMPDFLSELRGK